jgi:hypothetical protein
MNNPYHPSASEIELQRALINSTAELEFTTNDVINERKTRQPGGRLRSAKETELSIAILRAEKLKDQLPNRLRSSIEMDFLAALRNAKSLLNVSSSKFGGKSLEDKMYDKYVKSDQRTKNKIVKKLIKHFLQHA